MAIPVFNPTIRRKEMDAVLTCLVSDQIGPGEINRSLLEKLSDYLPHAGGVCFREPQRALEYVLKTLFPEGAAKILVSALAPSYYVDAIQILGMEVELCDVDPSSGVILTSEVEKKIEDCQALILDYPMGNFPDFEFFSNLSLPIIEDISCSIGTSAGEQKTGTLGSYVLINMEENHLITSGGGAVVLAPNRSNVTKLKKSFDITNKSVLLPNMNAVLALVQAGSLAMRLEKRATFFNLFLAQLQRGGHKTLSFNGGVETLLFSFPVVVDVGMDHIISYANKKQIETLPAFSAVALDQLKIDEKTMPNALSLKLRTLLFPLYSNLGSKNADLISKVLLSLP